MPFIFLDRETERQFAQTDSLTDNLRTDFAAAETIHECNGHFTWDDEEEEMSYALICEYLGELPIDVELVHFDPQAAHNSPWQ